MGSGARPGRVGRRGTAEDPDPVDLARGLGAGDAGLREGPESERGDKGPPVHHWITSSARASTAGGIVRPSAFAVLRLMTSSNVVGAQSAGRRAWRP